MNSARYRTGELATTGDVVAYNGQKGRITAVGDALIDWGVTKKEIAEGRVFIEFDNGARLCTNASDHEMVLISAAK
jgi:hypothetical protein